MSLIAVLRLGMGEVHKKRFYEQFVRMPVFEDMAPWNVVLIGSGLGYIDHDTQVTLRCIACVCVSLVVRGWRCSAALECACDGFRHAAARCRHAPAHAAVRDFRSPRGALGSQTRRTAREEALTSVDDGASGWGRIRHTTIWSRAHTRR